jgi:hypothetical protein
MSEQDQDAVTTTTEQDTELDLNLDDTEDVEALKQKLADADEAKRQITARAKKAEEEVKRLKATSSETTHTINNSSLTEESVDVKILESQGVDSDSIAYLKKLAKVNGTSILAAQSDDIYKTWKSNQEATAKAEKAKLGASRGSGSARQEKAFTSANLSDEDHKALWLKSQGR